MIEHNFIRPIGHNNKENKQQQQQQIIITKTTTISNNGNNSTNNDNSNIYKIANNNNNDNNNNNVGRNPLLSRTALDKDTVDFSKHVNFNVLRQFACSVADLKPFTETIRQVFNFFLYKFL